MSAVDPIQPDSSRQNLDPGTNLSPDGKDLVLCRQFLLFSGFLCLFYAAPLWRLLRYAWNDDTFSYLLMVPVVSAYLVVTSQHPWTFLPRTRPLIALVPALVGIVTVVGWCLARLKGASVSENAFLGVMTVSFLCLLVAGGCWFLGGLIMQRLSFPAMFLVFMIPIPNGALEGINVFLQHASAEAANMMLRLGGPPFVREGLLFQLPGITLMVAEECSGIRSTLVLFITSNLASYLFLRSGWRRTVLVAVVLPIAILRNGFRIYVIAMLCVHIDPSMIHSIIHHRGGPLFFALSLIPLFALMVWFRKKEHEEAKDKPRSEPVLDRGLV